MLRYIAVALAETGHDISVISSQPSYKKNHKVQEQPWLEMIDGFTINRLRLPKENKASKLLRIWGMSIFSYKLFIELLREKPDVVMISTVPQVLGGLVIRLFTLLTRSKYIYHCQDIHPEIAKASGLLKNKFLYNILLSIDRSTCNNALYTVVLSEDMRKAMIERGCRPDNLVIINNFELIPPDNTNVPPNLPTSMTREKEKFRLIFAGNIGRFQRLETIIDTAHNLSDIADIEFVFIGEGVAVEALKKRSGDLLDRTVFFYGHQSIMIARQLISDSQLAIVSLNDDIYKYAFPSKTMTYLCEDSPLLVIVNTNSELAKIVRKENLGIVSAPEDIEKITKGILSLYHDRNLLGQLKEAVKKYSNKNYRLDNVLPKWVSLFNGIDY